MTEIDYTTLAAGDNEDELWKEVFQDDWELCLLSVCLSEMFSPRGV